MIINFQGHKMGIISKFFSPVFFSALMMISSSGLSQNLSEADSLLSENRFSEAIEIMENALQANPDDKQLKGEVEEARRLREEAEKKYADALQDGQQLLREEKYQQARKAFREALEHKPNASYPQMKLDEIKKLYKDPQEEKAFEEAVEEADAHMNAFRYEAALEQYQKALEIKPRNVEALKKVKQVKNFVSKQKERDRNYRQYVENAENYFEDGNYERAMLQFQEALLIKPDKNLPKTKIEEIRGLLDEEKQKTQKYEERIEIADSLYMAKQFSDAKEVYRQALTIKPSETYPVNMIRKIDPNLDQPEPLNTEYLALIEQADLALRIKDYDEARKIYRKALEINPDEDYPQQKLDEIEDQLAKAEERKETYQELVRQGKDAFEKENYPDAKQAYEQAAQQFSDSTYPQEQIAEIKRILAGKEANQQRFDSLTALAETHFQQNKFNEALASYKEAKAIFPEKGDIEEKIREINDMLENQQEEEQQYQSIIATADSLFNKNNYQDATASYREAQNLKPEAEYPEEKIQKINKLTAENEKAAKYNQLISSAETSFEQDNLQQARSKYKEASEVYADSTYPQEQIARIERITSEKEADERRFDSLINVANRYYEDEEYNNALSNYEDAKTLFPNNNITKEKIREIDRILDKQEAREKEYEQIVNMADSLYNAEAYQEAIAAYQEAQEIIPERDYPSEQISKSKDVMANIREEERMYKRSIANADSLFEEQNFEDAIAFYEDALEIKENDSYAKKRVTEAQSQIEHREESFRKAMEQGNNYLEKEEYQKALNEFEKALALKEENEEAIQKRNEAQKSLEKIRQKMLAEYNAIIEEANSHYDNKDFSKAIEKYEEAASVNPDADYPQKRIKDIREWLAEHSLREIVNQPVALEGNSEKKFDFQPITYRDRGNNFIVLTASRTGGSTKIFLNYGAGDQRHGGVVISNVPEGEARQFVFNLTERRSWRENENNWISVYTQGGGISINGLDISKGD